jgi:phage terminase large subunit
MLFTTGPLYIATVNSKKKYIIHQGGTSSGKTYAILQSRFVRCVENPGIVSTVVGQDIPNLKLGAMRMANQIYDESKELKYFIKDFNQTDRKFTFKNRSILEFTAFENEQDAKSGKRDDLFINEANGIPWTVAWQLMIRSKSVCIDYNPTTSFWVHKKLIGRPDVEYIISDHRHNPFLTEEQHDEIEGIEDKDLWWVYARGRTGDIKGIIYPNWKEVDKLPETFDEEIWAIDYGYTVDPTAIVKMRFVKPKSIYVKEICYTPGLSEHAIIEVMTKSGFEPGMAFYSEHDPDKVAQLRSLGIPVWMAEKGPGSIKNGIMKVKQFDVYYTSDSNWIREERSGYKWQEVLSYDGSSSNIVNLPDPKYRAKHLLDAIKYGIYSHFFRQ